MSRQLSRFGGSAVAALVGFGWLSSACGSSGDDGEAAPVDKVVSELRSSAPRVVPEVAESARAGVSEQRFGFDFLQVLDADENLAFSPHSLSTAFAMLSDASTRQTLLEIEEAFHFGATDEAFHRSQDALELGLAARNRAAIDREDTKVEAQVLAESNDIWIRHDVPPEQSFLDTLARFYGAGVYQTNFRDEYEAARVAINAKVSVDTHDLIGQLLPPDAIGPLTVAVLTNALYFKAPWASAFEAPVAGPFHPLDGSTVSVDMLHELSTLAYYAGDGFVSVSLPYYGGELEMMLIVPDSGAYASVRGALSADVLAAIVAARQPSLLDLSLPKFDVKSTVQALAALKALGIKAAFDEDLAEFPKLETLYPDVVVSDVLHQATVAIDEKGTEASAATAIVIRGVTSGPLEPPSLIELKVDRPFLFVIRDNPTGAVLFLGQVVAP